ncbi:cytochrome ubiquinol oxidase subunit I [Leptothoe sp. EHU-05/26/07-4]
MTIYFVVLEGLWLRTKNKEYYHHARFWSKLYVLNFGIGVASGLPMEFQFGTNWAPFSEAVAMETTLAELVPNQRPVEAQQ